MSSLEVTPQADRRATFHPSTPTRTPRTLSSFAFRPENLRLALQAPGRMGHDRGSRLTFLINSSQLPSRELRVCWAPAPSQPVWSRHLAPWPLTKQPQGRTDVSFFHSSDGAQSQSAQRPGGALEGRCVDQTGAAVLTASAQTSDSPLADGTHLPGPRGSPGCT